MLHGKDAEMDHLPRKLFKIRGIDHINEYQTGEFKNWRNLAVYHRKLGQFIHLGQYANFIWFSPSPDVNKTTFHG